MSETSSKPRLTITLTGVGIAAIVGAGSGIVANLKGEPKAELAYERLSKVVEEMSGEQRQLHDRLIKMEAYWEIGRKKEQQCKAELVKIKRFKKMSRGIGEKRAGGRQSKAKPAFDFSKDKKSMHVSPSPPVQQQAPAVRKMPPLEFESKK